ncbi:MAG: cation-translocating P-type ATPase [Chitinophagaceae bacterium]|nr:MAG: cation-translocating P-type ATPase [Chitinophagaceae bacterium]
MTASGNNNTGLTTEQVSTNRQQYGSNTLEMQEDRVLLQVLKDVVLEPMFILLLAACIIYFVVGQYQEGIIMLVSIFIVAGISLFQEYRSKNAVKALKKLSAARAKVIRNGRAIQVATEEIVVNDLLLLEEGEVVAADGLIVLANDFSLNESILTGESFTVAKNADNNNNVYKGTLVTSGSATIKVSAVGLKTMFGKIGLSLKEITIVKTPLQQQIRSFVRNMVWIGAVAFLIVVGFNYYQSGNFVRSFLQGLTLAMSILPEEIPVAFSTFQALGAFRLLRNHIIVKQPQYVETLGSATVICTDKTGTLTQNKMSIEYVYDAATKISVHINKKTALPALLIEYAMWSSETTPFDPMEKAIHELYEKTTTADKRKQFEQIHEYPVAGRPPMMTHIFKNENGETIIAAKGGPEAILRQSNLSIIELKHIEEQSLSYAKLGYRVLGVGKGSWMGKKWPPTQDEFVFEFLGLIAFQDPPKENITRTIQTFHDAGIPVKMITGDYAETALAIAGQIQLNHNSEVLTGKEVLHLTKEELQQKVKRVNIFARMFPEAKLKVIDALKENGEVVAMTGDGVNDGPALKAAHIGIAMGQRGSEVAKSAASLILTDDDLAHMTDAVALGRKIYDNLKKAIQYIVSIHIPIILIVTLPLLLMWKFTDIFSPVHVIFLELIMGPTCSIIYENEPIEPGTMQRPPRKMGSTFLSLRQLTISIAQGFMITAGCLGIGYYYIHLGDDETTIRSVIFITLLFCNIFLTLVNRSFQFSAFKTITYKNNLIPLIIGITFLFIVTLLYVPFIRNLFRLNLLSFTSIATCVFVAVLSVLWIEIWKSVKRKSINAH